MARAHSQSRLATMDWPNTLHSLVGTILLTGQHETRVRVLAPARTCWVTLDKSFPVPCKHSIFIALRYTKPRHMPELNRSSAFYHCPHFPEKRTKAPGVSGTWPRSASQQSLHPEPHPCTHLLHKYFQLMLTKVSLALSFSRVPRACDIADKQNSIIPHPALPERAASSGWDHRW